MVEVAYHHIEDFPLALSWHLAKAREIKWSPKWSPTIGNGEGIDGSGWNGKLKFVNEIKLGGMR
jgi:hypothetical protein